MHDARSEVGAENDALWSEARARLMPRVEFGVVEFRPRDPGKCSFCGASSCSEIPKHCLTCGMERR